MNSINSTLKYKLLFISFFAPQTNKNFKMLPIKPNIKKKIYFKQSYLLLTWFYYLTFSKKLQATRTNFLPKIIIRYYPNIYRKFTLNKAPMAHKTNSKEQFLYMYHKFSVAFKIVLNNNLDAQTPNWGLLLVFLIKKKFKVFETNLLFLKTYKINFVINASTFFNYWRYLN